MCVCVYVLTVWSIFSILSSTGTTVQLGRPRSQSGPSDVGPTSGWRSYWLQDQSKSRYNISSFLFLAAVALDERLFKYKTCFYNTAPCTVGADDERPDICPLGGRIAFYPAGPYSRRQLSFGTALYV